jgi:hypothetical protein
MTSLGEIVLKFGASGAGEEPLRFTAGHINHQPAGETEQRGQEARVTYATARAHPDGAR